MIRKFALACALCLVACVAIAAKPWVDIEKRLTPEQLHATGLDGLTTEQLALLNRLLRDEAAADATDASEDRADTEARQSRMIGFNDEPIVSRLQGTLSGWEPGTEFELANGQRWKVLKGHFTLRTPLDSPEVKIDPGAAGLWFFRIDDDSPGARV
jgi:hypothetical protein